MYHKCGRPREIPFPNLLLLIFFLLFSEDNECPIDYCLVDNDDNSHLSVDLRGGWEGRGVLIS